MEKRRQPVHCKTFLMDEQRSLSQWSLTVTAGDLASFTTLLQSGFRVTVLGGKTLLEALITLPGFTPDYLAATVQTIFCNGVPVDDLRLPVPGEGAVVALSAAMPGLAGAIFRKNSIHAPLRGNVTTHEELPGAETTCFTLKLFNSIALERGGELLRHGVVMLAATVASFLDRRPELVTGIVAIACDGQSCRKDELLSRLHDNPEQVHLEVREAIGEAA